MNNLELVLLVSSWVQNHARFTEFTVAPISLTSASAGGIWDGMKKRMPVQIFSAFD